MKTKPFSITIDPFGWDVSYLFVTKHTTLKEFTAFLDAHKILDRQGSMDNFNHKTAGNAGEHYYDMAGRCSTVIIYPCTSPLKRIVTLVHENRHVTDRLCKSLFIDDIETPAYIEDFLMDKVLNYLKANKL